MLPSQRRISTQTAQRATQTQQTQQMQDAAKLAASKAAGLSQTQPWTPTTPITGGGTPSGPQPPNTGSVGGVTPFTQDQNLIGSQISPTTSPRLDAQANTVDGANQEWMNWQPRANQPVAPVNTQPTLTQYGKADAQFQNAKIPGYEGVQDYDASGALAGFKRASQMGESAGDFGISSGNSGGAASGVSFGGDVGRARALGLQGLESSFNSPDRGELAAQQFAQIRDRGQASYNADLKRATQSAAAMGRTRAGMTTTELMDINALRERDLDRTSRELATDSAGRTLQDTLDRTSAAGNLASQFGGLDISAANTANSAASSNAGNALDRAEFLRKTHMDRSDAVRQGALDEDMVGRRGYDDSVRERDNRYSVGRDELGSELDRADASRRYGQDLYGVEEDEFGRRVGEEGRAVDADVRAGENKRQRYTDAQNEEDRIRGYEGADRDELRGERDYQYNAEQDAIAQEERKKILEDQFLNSRTNRGLDIYNAGRQGNPSGAQQTASDRYGDQAREGYEASGDLLSQMAQDEILRNRQPQTGGGYPGGVQRDQYGNEIDPLTGKPKQQRF